MSTPYAAILLSRQPRRPYRTTPWVQAVRDALHEISRDHVCLLTSTGMQTWELTAAAASITGVPQMLHLPECDRPRAGQWIEAFALDPARDGIRFLPETGGKEFMAARDRAVVERADILFPVSIRPGGAMESLAVEAARSGRTIIDRFTVPYQPRSEPLKYDIDIQRLNPDLQTLDNRYLIHWTRTCNHAWPGERLIDYYRAVLESGGYPRSALDTLMRILTTRTLRASSRHMPANTPTVSLTALSIAESLPLMRWRARYGEMSFEPYGVAIARDTATRFGIREVRYVDATTGRRAAEGDAWLAQSIGRRTDWRQEREFRARGDLDLSRLPGEDLIAVCYLPQEAQKVTALTGVRAVSILADR